MEYSQTKVDWKTALWLISIGVLLLTLPLVTGVPSGPTATIFGNTTKNPTSSSKVNSTINGTISPGAYIFTANLNLLQQDTRWKGYVGNITGTLTLDDASDDTIFQWALSSVTGEVYATRASGSINWTGINCTWIYEGSRNATESNRSAEHVENQALSHTNLNDNITATFVYTNHSSITVGAVVVGKNQCFSAQTYQRDAAQVFADSDQANFTQVILYDGAFNKTTGNVVYTTKIESDKRGYRSDSTFDFQMMLPENGATGYTGSTAYYFYVELT